MCFSMQGRTGAFFFKEAHIHFPQAKIINPSWYVCKVPVLFFLFIFYTLFLHFLREVKSLCTSVSFDKRHVSVVGLWVCTFPSSVLLSPQPPTLFLTFPPSLCLSLLWQVIKYFLTVKSLIVKLDSSCFLFWARRLQRLLSAWTILMLTNNC